MPPRYRVLDLGTLGGVGVESLGINNGGQVIGGSGVAGSSAVRAFRTSRSGINPATDNLGLPPGFPVGSGSIARAINNNGQVVVEADPPSAGDAVPRSYLVAPDGKMDTAVDIGSLGAFTFSNGINDGGQIVGRSGYYGAPGWHAFLYTPGLGMRDLGSLGGPYSEAFDVNNAGQVVGSANIESLVSRAFRTAPNSRIQTTDNLGTLGGDYSNARAINNLGQVAGMSDIAGGSASHIFRTAPDAPINPATDDLGTRPGGTFAEPYDMNDAGDIVGWSTLAGSAPPHAFLVRGATLYDLNDLVEPGSGMTLYYASGINDRGEIAASGVTDPSGRYHALLLVPVPEPSAAGVVSVMTGGTWLLRRRRPLP